MVIYFCKINTYSISAPTLFLFFLYIGGGQGEGGRGKKMDEAERDGKVEGALPWEPALLRELLTHLNLGNVNARFIFFC